jgi:hypothetical protein
MFELLTALVLALAVSTATHTTTSNIDPPPTQQASNPGEGGDIIIRGG